MKNQIIGGVILLIIAGLFAKYKVFDDKVELKYSLSEKIPSDFVDDIDEEGIQQLTIKNSGSVLISSIVIKINANVHDVKVNKFKSTDSISITKSNKTSEILYPEIPPFGEVIVLLKVKGSSIDKNNVEVYHSKGTANEAFSDTSSYRDIVFFTVLFVYLIIIFFYLRKGFVDLLESRAKYSYLDILRRKKPWYVKDSKWIEIRNSAISNYIEKDYTSTIEKSESYQLLNTEKKEFLSEDEWFDILKKAEDKILRKITEKIYDSYYNMSFEELSNLKKPINISYKNWKKINEEISKAFCMHKLRDTFLFGHIDLVTNILNSQKPEVVTDDDWSNLKTILLTYYTSNILEKGVSEISYKNYIDNVNLDILEPSRRTEIVNVFKNIKEGYEKEEYYGQLLQIIHEMFYWDKVPNKPKFARVEDWKKIEGLYSQVIKKKKEAMDNLSEAKKIKAEFVPLKEKITRQLCIIDNLLNEPTSIDKIETFDNPFAKGNWESV